MNKVIKVNFNDARIKLPGNLLRPDVSVTGGRLIVQHKNLLFNSVYMQIYMTPQTKDEEGNRIDNGEEVLLASTYDMVKAITFSNSFPRYFKIKVTLIAKFGLLTWTQTWEYILERNIDEFYCSETAICSEDTFIRP